MKLKKLLDKYIALKTRLVIKVSDEGNLKKVVGTNLINLHDNHADLLDCKVLQIDANGNNVLGVIVAEIKE